MHNVPGRYSKSGRQSNGNQWHIADIGCCVAKVY